MIRVYFDWNVLTVLKKAELEDPYKSIWEKIMDNREYLLIPYSPAHMSDLFKGWDPSGKNDSFIQRDLQFLSDLTWNLVLVQYWKEPDVHPAIRDPKEYFEETKKEKNQSLAEMMDLSSLGEGLDDDTRKVFDEQIAKLNAIQLDYGQEFEKNIEAFKKIFPDIPVQKQGQPFLEYLKDIGGYYDKVMRDHEAYRSLRDVLRVNLNLDSNISNWSNPIDRLDQYLPTTPIGKSFTQHVEEVNKKESTKSSNEFYDNFLMAYAQLDMFGYHPEKLSKKNTYENMSNDGQHAFYAAHCDFFVTNDKTTFAKASALYERYGIQTVICRPEDFVRLLTPEIKPINEYSDFITPIYSLIKTLAEKGLYYSVKEEGRTQLEIPLGRRFLHFFNTFFIIEKPDVDLHILMQIPTHQGKFLFYKEVETVTNQLVRILGEDADKKGFYDCNSEDRMINEGIWGRQWKFTTTDIRLVFNQDGMLQLIYELPKTNTPETTNTEA